MARADGRVSVSLVRSYMDVAQQLLLDGAVPLGLLRAGGPLGYAAVALPNDESIQLTAGDAVYVLAPHDWAQHHLTGAPF